MGLKYSASESEELIANLKKTLKDGQEVLNQLDSANSVLVGTVGSEGMQGKAFEAAGSFFENYVARAVSKTQNALEACEEDLSSYQGYDKQVAHYGKLDEDQLLQAKASAEQVLNVISAQLMAPHSAGSEELEWAHMEYNNQLHMQAEIFSGVVDKINKQIQDLHEFDSNTSSLFKDNLKALLEGLKLVAAFSDFDGDVASPSFEKIKSLFHDYAVDSQNVYREARLNRAIDKTIKDLVKKDSATQRASLKKQLRKQISEFKEDGWDIPANLAYLKYVTKYVKKEATGAIIFIDSLVNDCFKKAHLVGSNVYTKMYEACRLSPVRKLNLVMDQLGCFVDKNNFMQVKPNAKYKLDPDLEPMGRFWGAYRKTALNWAGQGKKSLSDLFKHGSNYEKATANKLNLFRTIIDKQNIDYLNSHFPNEKNDLARLEKYIKEYNSKHPDHKIEIDTTIEATYHNRILMNNDSSLAERKKHKAVPHNFKVQLSKNNTYSKESGLNDAGMVEFIFNIENYSFSSEWNVYKYDSNTKLYDSNPDHYSMKELEQVANTESFNYGIPKGALKDKQYYNSHNNLDIDHPKDNKVRARATGNLKGYKEKAWLSPVDYYNNGKYVDIVKKGGIKDVQAWNKITNSKKENTYLDYLKYSKHYDTNDGFALYASSH